MTIFALRSSAPSGHERRPEHRSGVSPFAALVLTIVLLPAPSAAQPACGGTIAAKAKVTLTADIGPCDAAAGDPALTIEGGATLDMNGHRLFCDTGNRPDGIVVEGKGVKLLNGTVFECARGIDLVGDGSHKLTNVVSRENSDDGIRTQSPKNKLTGTVTIKNGNDGHKLESDGNTLKRTVSGFNGRDNYALRGDKNKLTDTVSYLALGIGLHFDGDKNKVTKALVTSSIDEGALVDGDGNVLKQIRAVSSSDQNVRVQDDATGTKISKSVLLGSLNEADAEDESETCGSSKWSRNVFGSALVSGGAGDQTCIE